ncbi:MAG TPA: hypothetical protein VGM90_01740 [Kofleriaceae bacterium]
MVLAVVAIGSSGVAGCVIPPELHVEVNASEYRGICRCETCSDYDPATLMCRPGSTILKETDVTQCDDPTDIITQTRTNALETQLNSVCERTSVPGTTCRLRDDIDFVGAHASSPSLDLPFGEKTCATIAPDGEPLPRIDPGVSTQLISNAVVTSSTITLTSPDGSGTTNATGRLEFIGGNCTTGSCPIRLVWLPLQAANFSFAGHTIEHPFFINTTIGEGTFFAGSGVFVIPGEMQITASGTLSGDRRGLVSGAGAVGVGILNQAGRQLVFAQTYIAGDVKVDIQIIATIDNLLPTVTLGSTPLVECNTAGGANIALPALVNDVDGTHHTSQWYIDGILEQVDTDELRRFMPLGPHDVQIVVFDESGGSASASTVVTVVDTTPPSVLAGPFCLWPPNHKSVVVGAEMIQVFDACDPDPSFTFGSGVSSQGDGDFVVKPSSVCVRAERDGNDQAGRTYTITGTTSDAYGNSGTVILPIIVPHDQGNAPACTSTGETVDDSDPRCTATSSYPRLHDDAVLTVPVEDAEQTAESSRGGCATSNSSNTLFSSGLTIFLLVVRRRRR